MNKRNIFILLIFFVLKIEANKNYNIFQNICENQDEEFSTSTGLWKYKMYDASTKISSGILTNNTSNFGNYEECLKIESNATKGAIIGKYCLYNVAIKTFDNNTIKLRNSICLPDKCKLPKVHEHFKFNENSCQTKRTFTEWTIGDILVLLYFTSLFLMVVLGTIVDIKGKADAFGYKFLCSFSLRLNIKSLTKIDTRIRETECFNGIRVFCMLWILCAHSSLSIYYSSLKNISEAHDLNSSPQFFYIFGGHFTLQTFFFMSSFLISFSNFKDFGKNSLKMQEIPKFYIHRILRFIPALYSLLLIYLTLLKKFSSGPDWPYMLYIIKTPCVETWWSIILLFQNYVSPNTPCMLHSWYIAAEIHMFLLSPLILLPASYLKDKSYKLATIFMIVVAALSILVPCTFDLILETKNFKGTHRHLFSSAMGLLMGMLMSDPNAKYSIITKKFKILIWTLLVITMVILASLAPMTNFNSNLNFNMLLPFGYFISNLFTSWVVFNCLSCKEGLFNRLLTWKGFQPLAKLSFSVYLLHIPIYFIDIGHSRTPITFSHVTVFYSFCGNFIKTLLAAVIWTLFLEIPYKNLENILLKKVDKKEELRPDELKVINSN